MFVQHAQLKHLAVGAEKVGHLHAASSSVQLAFSGYPPQLCRAYLVRISGASKELVVVAFHLLENEASIFFVPRCGEVTADKVERVYEEGYSFIESMGFILTETDFHRLSLEDKRQYLKKLPICQAPQLKSSEAQQLLEQEVAALRTNTRQSFGRFLASF